jgi:hypothetical protein
MAAIAATAIRSHGVERMHGISGRQLELMAGHEPATEREKLREMAFEAWIHE